MFIAASTPHHLLNDSVTISNLVISQETSGAWESTSASTPVTVLGFVQPVSSSDNLQYGRDTTTRLCKVFLAPTDTDGNTYTVNAQSSVTISSVAYRVVESDTDLCNAGVLKRIIVEYPT